MKNYLIDDQSEARIERLRQIAAKFKSVAEFAREYKLNPAHISQIFTGRRSFGFRAAAKMGEKIANDSKLFDKPAGSTEQATEAQSMPAPVAPNPTVMTAPAERVVEQRVHERRDASLSIAAELLDAFSRMPEIEQKKMLHEAKYRAGLADLEREEKNPKLKHVG